MVARNYMKKSTAKMAAARARKKGLTATVFKKKGGYGTSTTR